MTDGGVPQYLVARVRERVAADAHELGIQVDLQGGIVHLRGDVVSEQRSRDVEAIARAAAEGREIRNELSVVSAGEPGAAERLS